VIGVGGNSVISIASLHRLAVIERGLALEDLMACRKVVVRITYWWYILVGLIDLIAGRAVDVAL